jgi:hypothetical protein
MAVLNMDDRISRCAATNSGRWLFGLVENRDAIITTQRR